MEHHVITTFQSGFTAGDSTVNQIVDVYKTFCRALGEGKEVRAIFFDISKAFDRVFYSNCNLLVSPVLFWNGLQTIILRESSVLFFQVCLQTGQLLKQAYPRLYLWAATLLVYINDIVEDISSTIRLFADDTSLYLIVDSPLEAAMTLNRGVSRVYAWAKKWLVTFNPDKSEALLISRKYNRPYYPPICMNGQPISEVNSHKHLGIILSNDCTWHAHFELIKAEVKR